MDQHRYTTIRARVRGRFTVSGSRFIGTMAPAIAEKGARELIESVRAEFPDATHHAYAYCIGAGPALIERCSDDREPAGTAGPPMLQVLQGDALSDVAVVATRYFGGTRLGIGGLTRAYRRCALECLKVADLLEKEQLSCCLLTMEYSELGAVTRHIESLGGEIIEVNYTDRAALKAAVPARLAGQLHKGFMELTRGQGKWKEEL